MHSSKQPFSAALQLYQFGSSATTAAGIQHAKTVIFRQVGVNNFFHFRFCDFWNGPTECEFVKIRYQFNTQQLNAEAINPPNRIDIDCRIKVGYSLPLCGDRRYKKWIISTEMKNQAPNTDILTFTCAWNRICAQNGSQTKHNVTLVSVPFLMDKK